MTKEYFHRPYVIVDGGYHNWVVTIAANDSFRSDQPFINWRKRMESVRKDIECVFGRLKARFRILKNPILFQAKHKIDNIFVSCCILYNMCHVWDNLSEWEVDANLDHETENTLYYEPIYQNNIRTYQTNQTHEFDVMHNAAFPPDTNLYGVIEENMVIPNNLIPSTEELVETVVETDVTYKMLREKLINHYRIAQSSNDQNRPIWLRSQNAPNHENR